MQLGQLAADRGVAPAHDIGEVGERILHPVAGFEHHERGVDHGLRGRDLAGHDAVFIPFTAETRMSGVDIDGREFRKGAADAVRRDVEGRGGQLPSDLAEKVDDIARGGSTPLVVCEGNRVLGVVTSRTW